MLSFNLSMVGLELAPHKIVLIDFNRKNFQPGESSIKVNEVQIDSSPSTWFLGFDLDYRLNFTTRVANLKKRCLQAMNVMKFSCGVWWGADPFTLLVIYKSFIRSKLDHGSFFYMFNDRGKCLKIERVQYRAIRIALGYRISTPVNILLAESCLTSIRDRAILLGDNFVAKNRSRSGTLTCYALNSFIGRFGGAKSPNTRVIHECIYRSEGYMENTRVSPDLPIFTHAYETITHSIPFDFSVGPEVKRADNPHLAFEKLMTREDAVLIFTDGSKVAEGVGSACTSVDGSVSITRGISPMSSIFTAECIALNDALDVVANSERPCLLFSDSLSSL